MTFKQWLRLQSNRAKMIAYLMKELPKMVAAISAAGYVETRSIQKWIQNNITKLVPTEIDDRIIAFDQNFEDTYIAPRLKDWAQQYIKDFKGDLTWEQFRMENSNIKAESEAARRRFESNLIAKGIKDAANIELPQGKAWNKARKELENLKQKGKDLTNIEKEQENDQQNNSTSGFYGGKGKWVPTKEQWEQAEKLQEQWQEKGFP